MESYWLRDLNKGLPSSTIGQISMEACKCSGRNGAMSEVRHFVSRWSASIAYGDARKLFSGGGVKKGHKACLRQVLSPVQS